jgi:hypothetical protein
MSNTPREPGASTATPTGEPETPSETSTGEPGRKQPAKPRIKITKNENGTFRADDLSFKINSMNDSTITLNSGNKQYKIGKKNDTYTIDGVTFQIQSSNIQTQPNGSMMINVHVAPPSVEQTSSVKQVQTTQMNNQQRANINKYIGTREVQQQGVHWHLIGKDMAWKTEFGNFINSQKERLQQVKDPRERDQLFQKIKELNPQEKDTFRNLYLGYQFYNPGITNLPPTPKTPEEVQERFNQLVESKQQEYNNDFNTFVGVYRSAIEAEYNKLKYQNQFPQQMPLQPISSPPSSSEPGGPNGFDPVIKPKQQGGKKRATRKRRPSKMSKRLKTRRVT